MHLTLSPGRTTARKAAAAAAATPAHARSASEPCHPALARLGGGVRALRAWAALSSASAAADRSSSGYGLALVEAVLAALGELLAMPRAAAALALRGSAGDDRALDALLALADAYGTFGVALLAAKQSVADAEAGVRRGDGAAVAASVRAHRRAGKDLHHLAAAMRHASRHAMTSARPADAGADTEVVDAVTEAAAAAAEASAAVFLGCAAMAPDVSAMVHTVPSHKWLARLGVVPAARKAGTEPAAAVLERLEELEECIGAMESCSERVFRRLLQARVLLLNIHNPL